MLKGILRLDLPKDVYERTGLVGKAIQDGGRKHLKTRFCKRESCSYGLFAADQSN